uniref:NADH dehydrogenase subunit 6 n=1 Tax=Knipowitschia caucasica TaxID=637954 RepID=A0AAV2M2A3_KNICA
MVIVGYVVVGVLCLGDVGCVVVGLLFGCGGVWVGVSLFLLGGGFVGGFVGGGGGCVSCGVGGGVGGWWGCGIVVVWWVCFGWWCWLGGWGLCGVGWGCVVL